MASNVFVTPRSVSTIARGRIDTNSSLQALLQNFYSSAAPVDASVNLEGVSSLQNGMLWRQGGSGEPIGRMLVYDTHSPSHPLYSGFTREGIAYVSQNTLSQANSALSNSAFQSGELVRIIDEDKLYMVNKLSTAFIPFGTSDAANLWRTNNTYVYYTGGLNVGIGTATPSAKLDVVGDVEINSSVRLSAEAITLATITRTQIASFAASSFRSGKLLVQAYNSVTGEVQISELLIAHNGTTASSTEYGIVYTGINSFTSYDVDISGSNVRLMATGASTNSTQYKVSETLIVV
jgi:hypothetical protein